MLNKERKYFIIASVSALITIVIFGGVLVWQRWFLSEDKIQHEKPIANKTTVIDINEELASLTPKQVYYKMQSDVDKSRNFLDLETIFLKYKPQESIRDWEATKSNFETEQEKENFANETFVYLKNIMTPPKEVESFEEEIRGTEATLYITKKFGKAVRVEMILGRNGWKIQSQTWAAQ